MKCKFENIGDFWALNFSFCHRSEVTVSVYGMSVVIERIFQNLKKKNA